MKKIISVLLICCFGGVFLYAAVDKKITAEQAVKKITAGYQKQYRNGTSLKVKEEVRYGNSTVPYLETQRGLFIGCLNGECWPYGNQTYESGSSFLNTDRLSQDFPNDSVAATQAANANDCLGKEYMGGIIAPSNNSINTNTFTLEKFEDIDGTYKFTFNVTCKRECVGCAEKTQTYINKEVRTYNKKTFFPVKVTIENGDAIRTIIYEKAK